jgi:hypothetical protein
MYFFSGYFLFAYFFGPVTTTTRREEFYYYLIRKGSDADLLVRMMNENLSHRSVPPGNYSFLPVSWDPSGVGGLWAGYDTTQN